MSPKLQTYVVQAPWWEEAAQYADIVLPVNTNFERNDVTEFGVFWGFMPGATNWRMGIRSKKCIESLYESKSDLDICEGLATRLGLWEEVTEGNTEMDWVRGQYNSSSYPDFIDFDEFDERGLYFLDHWVDGYVPSPSMRWYYEMPEGAGMQTPSGKLELYSGAIAHFFGEDDPDIAPIPKDRPAPDLHFCEEYPLRAIHPHPTYRYHSMHGNVPWHREVSKVVVDGYEYEPIWINTKDAAARGIKQGDVVKVHNDVGAILCGAKVTERMVPGIVRVDYGEVWDPDDPRNPWLDRAGSANVLLSREPLSKYCYGHHFMHTMVQVEMWEG